MMHLSIDAGGTFIKYAWMDAQGNIVSQGKEPTHRTSAQAFQDVIAQLIEKQKDTLSGISLSLPGTIDAQTGFIYQGGSLTYHGQMNIKEVFEERFHVRVEVENDARCAALAEMTSGNMQTIDNGIVLTFGTGIGGCLIIDHKVYKGSHFFSGEVSMLACKDFRTYGMAGVYGNIGSIPDLIASICKAKDSALVDGKVVFDWIAQEDEIATSIFQEYCYQVVTQFFNLQLTIDPRRLCIGGGVSLNDTFMSGITKAMNAFYDALPIAIPRLEILPCKYHNDANLLGAFYHFMNQAWQDNSTI